MAIINLEIFKLHKDWRDILAYFLLGMFNPFGYSIMLTAAHDILHDDLDIKEIRNESEKINNTVERDCNVLSTGSILLADAVPAVIITAILSFISKFQNFKLVMSILLGFIGYITLAISNTTWLNLMGVATISLATGFGEITLLGYTSHYTNKDIISSWSSGTAASGLLSSFTHAGLTSLGIRTQTIFLSLLIVPVLLGLTFWCLLRKPVNTITELHKHIEEPPLKIKTEPTKDPQSNSFILFLKEFPVLMKYIIPVFFVYLFQYFINQGLTELIEFDDISLDHSSQYRWIQVIYQVGKLIGQSSGALNIDNIMFLAFLQFLNLIFYCVEVIYYVVPYIWIIFIFSFWEGLVGGATYVHALRRISLEVSTEKQNFALGMASLANMIGIVVSGLLAIPTHNAICQLSKPERL